MAWQPRLLSKSSCDVVLAGICGGLGMHTPQPSWLWRAIFIAAAAAGGLGLVAYLALWLLMPAAGVIHAPPNADHTRAAD